jgi:N-acetylglucosamine-6-phosphate deacetylase
VGKRADLILLTKDLELSKTLVNGRIVFQAPV